jgi:hypothetical protein
LYTVLTNKQNLFGQGIGADKRDSRCKYNGAVEETIEACLSERADTTVSKLEEMQAEQKERQTAGHQPQSLRQICIAISLY